MKVYEVLGRNIIFDENNPYEDWSQKMIDCFEWDKKENEIYEGLIITYDIEATVRILKTKWNSLRFKRGYPVKGVDSNDFEIRVDLNEISIEEVKELFVKINTCGWFISVIDLYQDEKGLAKIKKSVSYKQLVDLVRDNSTVNRLILFLEAKYDVEKNRKELPKLVYHISPKIFEEKIKKVGLIPKSLSKDSDHPSRIYLVKKEENARGDLFRQLKSKSKDGSWILLTIDLNSLPEDQRFFSDPNYPEGIYTLKNIPARTIIKIEDL